MSNDSSENYDTTYYLSMDREHEMRSLSRGLRCNCNRGYCEVHGTFHYQERFEMLELMQLVNMHRQSPMGQRAIRKPRTYE